MDHMDPSVPDPNGECVVDIYCNNDVLSTIFSYIDGFDVLSSIPFVCSRWRKVIKTLPLKFAPMKGWQWSFMDTEAEQSCRSPITLPSYCIASCEHKDFIPLDYIKTIGMEIPVTEIIKNVFWVSKDRRYILGTIKRTDELDVNEIEGPENIIHYFFYEINEDYTQRSITIHTNLHELLLHGLSQNAKNSMKDYYSDKLKKAQAYKGKRRRKRFKKYR